MRIVISGYGKMGHMVEEAALRKGLEIALASEDIVSVPDSVGKDCVCIDFTTPAAFRENYPVLARKFKAVVVGTTGWADIREDVFSAFEQAGTTLIWASNFSIGVNAFFAAIQRVSEVLKDKGYSPSVSEVHHIHKLDAPSGTAISIADIIESSLGCRPGISSERIGEVPGTHIAKFESGVDELLFEHKAFSRQGFAEGAVLAAIMSENIKGIHEFKEIIL